MREWFDRLGEAPEPLSPAERRLVWMATILIALTRLLAVSRSMWDWDEALFSSALRGYDVTQHHPHPPGFPYYIALAKVIHLVAGSEFRALQVVTFIGAAALFPLMFFLGRELRAGFSTALLSALLLAFLPNVWFFGGTAFSDVPSLALVLFACVLLLQGCRRPDRYLCGALMLGIAAGFRPQNLLVGLAPALIASWCRIRSTRSILQLLLATAIGLVTVVAAYGGAALATGDWRAYLAAVASHREYIAAVDSYTNPQRPSLLALFDDFFISPYRARAINIPVAILVAIGVLGALFRKSRGLGIALAMFGPFCLAGWLLLDHHSVSRFSIAWAPLIALAAAAGASIVAAGVASLWPSRNLARVVQGVPALEAAIVGALLVLMIVWTLPALLRVRLHDSPPIQAIQWVRANLPRDTTIYIQGGMGPFSDLLLEEYPRRSFEDDAPLPLAGGEKVWVLREGVGSSGVAKEFSYPQDHLWDLVRRRYFDTSVEPLLARIEFGPGWYDPERAGGRSWRWMGARSSAALPPLPSCARLTLEYYVPLDAMSGSPTVTVKVNGQVVDRFSPREALAHRSFVVVSRSDRVNELVIETDRAVNPAREGLGGDGRTLGVRLDSAGWVPQTGPCGAPAR